MNSSLPNKFLEIALNHQRYLELSNDSMIASYFVIILQNFVKSNVVKSLHRLPLTSYMISVDFKEILKRLLQDFQ